MARIAGTDIPNKKRVEFALTYIFGIGLHSSRLILQATGIDLNKRASELTGEETALIRNEIEKNYTVEGDLRKQTAMNIKTLMDLGSYRGLRHRAGLPCRGQKTKTNARTKKGKKKTVGAAAK
ncbi:MAG: 30S ribosomal protein S13 [Epsilonproteobacteria bacterium]|nr:MAG: 30S ribosomal protein S13 [Campylobacterota bacterium]